MTICKIIGRAFFYNLLISFCLLSGMEKNFDISFLEVIEASKKKIISNPSNDVEWKDNLENFCTDNSKAIIVWPNAYLAALVESNESVQDSANNVLKWLVDLVGKGGELISLKFQEPIYLKENGEYLKYFGKFLSSLIGFDVIHSLEASERYQGDIHSKIKNTLYKMYLKFYQLKNNNEPYVIDDIKDITWGEDDLLKKYDLGYEDIASLDDITRPIAIEFLGSLLPVNDDSNVLEQNILINELNKFFLDKKSVMGKEIASKITEWSGNIFKTFKILDAKGIFHIDDTGTLTIPAYEMNEKKITNFHFTVGYENVSESTDGQRTSLCSIVDEFKGNMVKDKLQEIFVSFDNAVKSSDFKKLDLYGNWVVNVGKTISPIFGNLHLSWSELTDNMLRLMSLTIDKDAKFKFVEKAKVENKLHHPHLNHDWFCLNCCKAYVSYSLQVPDFLVKNIKIFQYLMRTTYRITDDNEPLNIYFKYSS